MYEELIDFELVDEEYFTIHDKSMDLIEEYIRNYPESFVMLK